MGNLVTERCKNRFRLYKGEVTVSTPMTVTRVLISQSIKKHETLLV